MSTFLEVFREVRGKGLGIWDVGKCPGKYLRVSGDRKKGIGISEKFEGVY